MIYKDTFVLYVNNALDFKDAIKIKHLLLLNTKTKNIDIKKVLKPYKGVYNAWITSVNNKCKINYVFKEE